MEFKHLDNSNQRLTPKFTAEISKRDCTKIKETKTRKFSERHERETAARNRLICTQKQNERIAVMKWSREKAGEYVCLCRSDLHINNKHERTAWCKSLHVHEGDDVESILWRKLSHTRWFNTLKQKMNKGSRALDSPALGWERKSGKQFNGDAKYLWDKFPFTRPVHSLESMKWWSFGINESNWLMNSWWGMKEKRNRKR